MNELIEKKVRQIIQDPKIQSVGNAKNQIICLQILGDNAIEKACADDGDIKAAMKYILSVLPEPRILYLTCLAMIVALENEETITDAAKSIGVCRYLYYKRNGRYYQGIKRLNEEGLLRSSTTENPGRLPP